MRWTQVGRALPASWMNQPGMELIDLKAIDVDAFGSAPTDKTQLSYSLHDMIGNQTQAIWQAQDDQQQACKLLLTNVTLKSGLRTLAGIDSRQAPQTVQGEIAWWIDPRSKTYLSLACPEGLTVVGLEVNDQPVTWNKSSDGKLQVLLQPSYLPLRLKAYFIWKHEPARRGDPLFTSTALPLLIPDAQPGGPSWWPYPRLCSGINPWPGRAGLASAAWHAGSCARCREVARASLGSDVDGVCSNGCWSRPGRTVDMAAGLQPQTLGLNTSTLISAKSQFAAGGNEAAASSAGRYTVIGARVLATVLCAARIHGTGCSRFWLARARRLSMVPNEFTLAADPQSERFGPAVHC